MLSHVMPLHACISHFVRTEAMNAWDAYELGRLVHSYGGRPVGSMLLPTSRLLQPCTAHAMFLDQTHDNDSQIEVRTPGHT